MNMEWIAAVLVTSILVVALHMTARVFHAPQANVLWRVCRYVGGCIAILAGLLFVLDWANWLVVTGIVAVAGVSTIASYMAVELFNYHNRALLAEDDADQHYDL